MLRSIVPPLRNSYFSTPQRSEPNHHMKIHLLKRAATKVQQTTLLSTPLGRVSRATVHPRVHHGAARNSPEGSGQCHGTLAKLVEPKCGAAKTRPWQLQLGTGNKRMNTPNTFGCLILWIFSIPCGASGFDSLYALQPRDERIC